ncbi:MAG TPA: cyclic nucleotide-binding domain-containing protein [Nocardioidaceae bacterium]|nr:cyclic nucleotide-binding domain-containing protein [Nocardioidaceae bacterium]
MDTGGSHPDPILLRRFEIFESLGFADLKELSRIIATDDVEEGHVLNAEGDAGARFFVIVEGEAEVLKDGEVVRRLGPGEHFGEIALLAEGPRTASVVAATPMKLLVMFGTSFRLLEERFPAVAMAIYAGAASRMDDDDAR